MTKDSAKYYKTAYLPIFNFKQCEKGELQYLYKCDIDEVPETYPDYFQNIYMDILFELELDLSIIKLVHRVAKYDNLYAVTKDKKWLNKARLTEAEYKRRIDITNDKKDNFLQQVRQVEKYFNCEIDIFKYPTIRYFNDLDQIRNNGQS